jgi:hypothetical protein
MFVGFTTSEVGEYVGGLAVVKPFVIAVTLTFERFAGLRTLVDVPLFAAGARVPMLGFVGEIGVPK